MIKITVITVCLNSRAHIRQCMESVLCQTYPNIEYIVIDGGSQDGTVDEIKKFEKQIVYWISEKDGGIAEAMNKGLRIASGDYIIFLHSDDFFISKNAIQSAAERIRADDDIIAFGVHYGQPGKYRKIFPKNVNFLIYLKTRLLHQATFCHKDLFKRIGPFDTSIQIAMDYDFFLRAFQQGARVRIYSDVVTFMRDTGVSSQKDWFSLLSRFHEERKIHYKHCPNIWFYVIYKIYWFLYLPYRKLRKVIDG